MKQAEGVYLTPKEMAALTRQMPHTMQLQLAAKKASQRLGYHMTRLRGRGMSFAESREYQPGDEIRHIDWRVTARTGFTHTKTFEEERDRPVCLILDQSASMFIGSKRCFKAYLAAELAVAFGWLACRSQDRFGGIFVGEKPVLTPFKSGRKHWGHFCESIVTSNQSWDLTHDQNAMPWTSTLQMAKREVRPGSLVIIISDFFNHSIEQRDLYQLRRHADVLCVAIEDPLETNPPKVTGTLRFGPLQWFYQGQGDDQKRLQGQHHKRVRQLKQLCAKLGIGFFSASTEQSAIENLRAIIR